MFRGQQDDEYDFNSGLITLLIFIYKIVIH